MLWQVKRKNGQFIPNMDILSFLCRITTFYDENIVLGKLACTIKLEIERMRRAKGCGSVLEFRIV